MTNERTPPAWSRRLSWLLPGLVFLVALALLVAASRRVAPAFDELSTLSAVERARDLVRDVARDGLGALAAPEARRALPPEAPLLVLGGAWSSLSIGRVGLLDPLTAMRLPWLLLGALTSVALFAAVRPSRGRAEALLVAALLLLLPRWVHAVVVLSEGAVLAGVWAVVLACYVRSLGPAGARGSDRAARRTLPWALAGAAALGVGCSFTLATLWVLVPLVVHHVLVRSRSARRLARRGRLPLPSLLLYALPLAPVICYALSPALWKTTPGAAARFLLAPLAPEVAPAEYAGRVVERLPVPAGFGPSWLLQTLPVVVTLAALAGVLALVHHALARRFASGRLRPAEDRHAVGLLALVALAASVVGPALAPQPLTTFPPRVELALPFVALLAGVGLAVLARLPAKRSVGRSAVAVVLLALVPAALAPSTAGASFTPLLGGARRVVRTRALPAGDGSELGALLPALNRALGESGELAAPEVPPDLWRVLSDTRRVRRQLVVSNQAAILLARGPGPGGQRLADVRRDGAVLWSLSRR